MPLFLLGIIVYTRYTWKRVIWKSLLHAISGREENLQNLHLCHLKLFLFIYLFIDAFELWCWRLLRVPWTARRSNQSILKEISPGKDWWEAETPILLPPHAKSWLFGKDPDAGEDWGQEEKGTAEDEMVGWHHRLNGHGFGWTLGVGDGQGGLVCCSSWGRKESDMTERLNWTELAYVFVTVLGLRGCSRAFCVISEQEQGLLPSCGAHFFFTEVASLVAEHRL